MSIIKEFKEFAIKGNMLDLAIGVVIGAAFGKIISSLVSDIIMPPVGAILGGVNFTSFKIPLKQAVIDSTGKILQEPVALTYGNFLQTTVDFIIIAASVFLFVKLFNRLRKEEEKKPPEEAQISNEEKLLTEIRDLLKEKK